MADVIGLLFITAAGYFVYDCIYKSGKATGSRKGFHVGRKVGSRNARRRR